MGGDTLNRNVMTRNERWKEETGKKDTYSGIVSIIATTRKMDYLETVVCSQEEEDE